MRLEVKREGLLRALEAVEPGLAARETAALQSTCFLFDGGFVVAYNDECRCRAPSGLPGGVSGAVPAKKFREYLSKLGEDALTLEFDGNSLRLRTPRGR